MADAPTIETTTAAHPEERSPRRWWSVPLVVAGVVVLVVSWTVPAVEAWSGINWVRMAAFFAVMLIGMNWLAVVLHRRRAAAGQAGRMTIVRACGIFLGMIAWMAVFGLAISAVVYGTMPTVRGVLGFAPMAILLPLAMLFGWFISTRRKVRGQACPKCGSWVADEEGGAEASLASCTRCDLSPIARVITARPSDVFGGTMWQTMPLMVAIFVCLGVRPYVMPLIDGWFPGLVP